MNSYFKAIIFVGGSLMSSAGKPTSISDVSFRIPSFELSMLPMLSSLSLASIEAGARGKYEVGP